MTGSPAGLPVLQNAKSVIIQALGRAVARSQSRRRFSKRRTVSKPIIWALAWLAWPSQHLLTRGDEEGGPSSSRPKAWTRERSPPAIRRQYAPRPGFDG